MPTSPTEQMSVTVDRKALADALTFAAKAVPARPFVPVLTGVKITAEAGQVSVSVFDYEQARNVVIADAAVTTPGVVLVSHATLAKVLGKLPKTVTTVTLTASGSRCTLTGGTARLGMDTMPVEDYPTLPDTPPTVGTIGLKALADLVARVAKAAGTDDTLPVLTGVEVRANGPVLELTATDRYRAGMGDAPWAPTREALPMIVPARVLAESLATLVKVHGDTPVSIGQATEVHTPVNGKGDQGETTAACLIGLTVGGYTFTTRLISGDFPKVRKLMPTVGELATMNVRGLADTVNLVMVAAERSAPVRVTFTGDGTAVVATGASVDDPAARNTGMADTVGAEWTGAPGFRYAFDPAYLLAGLKTLGERVDILATDPSKPCLMRTAGDPDGYAYGLMPMRVEGTSPDVAAPPAVTTEPVSPVPAPVDTQPTPDVPATPEPEETMTTTQPAPLRDPAALAAAALDAATSGDFDGALILVNVGESVEAGFLAEGRFSWEQIRSMIAAMRPAEPPVDTPDTAVDTPASGGADEPDTTPGETSDAPVDPPTVTTPVEAPVDAPTAPELSAEDRAVLDTALAAALAAMNPAPAREVASPPIAAPVPADGVLRFAHSGTGHKAERKNVRVELYARSRSIPALKGVVCTVTGEGRLFDVALRVVPDGADLAQVWAAVDAIVRSVVPQPVAA